MNRMDLFLVARRSNHKEPLQDTMIRLCTLFRKVCGTRRKRVLMLRIVKDLRSIHNPDKDRSLTKHLRIHPRTMKRLLNTESFCEDIKDALVQAKSHTCSLVTFQCTAGKHQSMAAAEVSYKILTAILGRDSVHLQHASRHRRGSVPAKSANHLWIVRRRATSAEFKTFANRYCVNLEHTLMNARGSIMRQLLVDELHAVAVHLPGLTDGGRKNFLPQSPKSAVIFLQQNSLNPG